MPADPAPERRSCEGCLSLDEGIYQGKLYDVCSRFECGWTSGVKRELVPGCWTAPEEETP